jgi:hypothetical protein
MAKSSVLSTRTAPDVKAALEAEADHKGIRLAQLVAEVLREHVAGSGHPQTLTALSEQLDALASAVRKLAGDQLTAEQMEQAQKAFKEGKGCVHCGGLHLRYCPRVKKILFHGNEPAEVEYWPEGTFTWPEEILWPDEVQTSS